MDVGKEINKRCKELDQIIAEKKKQLVKVPNGILKVNSHNSGWQYYCRKDKYDKNGKYIKKSEREFAQALGQKMYDKKVLDRAEEEKRILQRLYNLYSKGNAEAIYEQYSKGYQSIITPIQIPEKEFVDNWINMDYQTLGVSEDAPDLFSQKEEKMRSKSEVLIANLLTTYHIPYHYEKSLYLNRYGTVYPDFTLLDIKQRREIYWEHLGMMDDEEYAEKNVAKIKAYEQNGFFPGEQLILTYETSRQPLNLKIVEALIRRIIQE